ncbi:hypothetical protein OIU76_028700 [Salix suchowensis]|nr:hypothetical protein OIU76_028700 [Salix suchowensis]
MEEAIKVLDSALSHNKWRLKFPAKNRLQIDIVALLTEMRPVIMVDYGGKLPELQDHLCALVKFCQQESAIFENLRVMLIEDMIYLIHVRGLAEYVKSSLNLEFEMFFVNLEEDPPKMVTQAEESTLVTELIRVQNLFSSFFPLNGNCNDLESHQMQDRVANAEFFDNKPSTSQSSEFIDLSCCMQNTEITVPTLNGWLLGYPVVYLFSKQHIEDAIYNLSTKISSYLPNSSQQECFAQRISARRTDELLGAL